jgi:hypothetical protein
MIPVVSRLRPFQHAFVGRLSELRIAYHGSPIVEGAGERFFDDSLRGGTGIRSRFVLMLADDTDPSTRAAAEQLADDFKDVLETRLGPVRAITLIRPDGYVAFEGRDAAALSSVREVVERQTAPRALSHSKAEMISHAG